MNNFNFGEVLTRAWQIIWKHKVLWIFGILASCGRGGSSGNSGGSGDNGFNGSGSDLPPQVQQWFQWIQNNVGAFIAITIAVVCVIGIIVTFLSAIGKIGLIRGAAQVEGGAQGLIFGQLFSESMPYFWRMFGLSLILAVPVLIVVIGAAMLVAFGLVAGSGNEAGGLALLGILPVMAVCFCLLVPVLFVVGMILRQAERVIILEELGVLPAISRGWEIFRGNLGPIILMAIMLAIIGIVSAFVVAIPILIIAVPAILAFALGGAESWTPMIFAAVCICLFIPVALLLNGIMTAYIETVWTLTYMRLIKPQTGEPVAPVEANA